MSRLSKYPLSIVASIIALIFSVVLTAITIRFLGWKTGVFTGVHVFFISNGFVAVLYLLEAKHVEEMEGSIPKEQNRKPWNVHKDIPVFL